MIPYVRIGQTERGRPVGMSVPVSVVGTGAGREALSIHTREMRGVQKYKIHQVPMTSNSHTANCPIQSHQLICSIPIGIEWSTAEFLQHDPVGRPRLDGVDVWGTSLVYYVVPLGNIWKGMEGSDARD